MSNYYVTKSKQGGWSAKREKTTRAAGNFKTQAEAEITAKAYSANSGGGEVRIQGRDGRFRDSDTVPPRNDPNPPKDMKH